jgi:HEAT repeat protein
MLSIKKPTFAGAVLMLCCVIASWCFADSGPAGDEAGKAYQKAYNLILDENWAEAIKGMEAVIRQYPNSSVADDAAFYICLGREKSGQSMESAFECYKQCIERYPKSSYADDAKANLIRLADELAKAGKPQFRAIVRSMGNGEDIKLKILAIQALINSEEPEKTLPVVMKLYDQTSNEEDREKILYLMNDIDSPEVTVKLSEIVQKDPSVEVRKKAVYALGDRGDDVAAKELMKIVRSKNPLEIRKAALYSIANADTPEVIGFLAQVAKTDEEQELAKAATFAINDTDSPESLKALQEIVKVAPALEVRKAALYALGDRDEADTVGVLRTVALSDADEELRRAAVYAIANNESAAAAQALSEILAKSKEEKVQEAALHAIADQQGRAAQQTLMNVAINNPVERLARTAVHALADASDGDVSLLLEVYRKAKFPEVRKAALFAIGDQEGKGAIEALGKVLEEEKDEELRIVVLHSIASAGEDQAVPILFNVAMNDPSIRIRSTAVQMLGEIGTPAAKDALMKILEKQ